MKNITITRLNTVAKCLTAAFMTDLINGYTPESDFTNLRAKVKYPTEIELIKGMLLKDKRQVIDGVYRFTILTCVMSTRHVLNSLMSAMSLALVFAANIIRFLRNMCSASKLFQ